MHIKQYRPNILHAITQVMFYFSMDSQDTNKCHELSGNNEEERSDQLMPNQTQMQQ
jgi:hypothetical protein